MISEKASGITSAAHSAIEPTRGTATVESDAVARVAAYHKAIRELVARPGAVAWELGRDDTYINYQLQKQRISDLWWMLKLSCISSGDDLPGHCLRTAKLSSLLGEALSCGHAQRRRQVGHWLFLAGLCHDAFKLAVSVSTVFNPGHLTAADQAAVHLHPVLIGQWLDLRGFDPQLCAAVRDHHEKTDGTGYPAGTVPGQWARWLAVADVYDALHSDRGYHVGLPVPECLARLRDFGLDAAAVAALPEVLEKSRKKEMKTATMGKGAEVSAGLPAPGVEKNLSENDLECLI